MKSRLKLDTLDRLEESVTMALTNSIKPARKEVEIVNTQRKYRNSSVVSTSEMSMTFRLPLVQNMNSVAFQPKFCEAKKSNDSDWLTERFTTIVALPPRKTIEG
jgi:hypothetical protein